MLAILVWLLSARDSLLPISRPVRPRPLASSTLAAMAMRLRGLSRRAGRTPDCVAALRTNRVSICRCPCGNAYRPYRQRSMIRWMRRGLPLLQRCRATAAAGCTLMLLAAPAAASRKST
ncbi:hypothetical protein D9M72_572330 [compost metagenome]